MKKLAIWLAAIGKLRNNLNMLELSFFIKLIVLRQTLSAKLAKTIE